MIQIFEKGIILILVAKSVAIQTLMLTDASDAKSFITKA
jgi:hypothetical protein